MKLRTIIGKIKKTSKKSKIVSALLVASVLPVLGMAAQANTTLMEGHVKALNVTTGETEYKDATDAKVDDVVQVQLWHHNRENPAAEKVSNTKVKFTVPTEQSKTQIITGTSSSDNGNPITDTTNLNLSMDRARIEYMPGTARFRYNKGAADGDASCMTGFEFPPERCYVTVTIPDEVVNGGVNLDAYRKGPLTGCNAYHETVTIQVRVRADVVSVNKYVRHPGEGADAWKTSTTARPGDKLEYLIRFKNEGNTRLDDVMVGDNLPKYHKYVAGTTKLQNGANPNGITISNDNITAGGINVGNYMPGAAGYVWFTVQLDGMEAYERCGAYDLRNVGVVRPKGMNEFYNTAQVSITVECRQQPEAPKYSCDLFKVTPEADRTVKVTNKEQFKYTATNGVTFKHVVVNWGDGSTPLTTNNPVGQSHRYDADNAYTITAVAHFTTQDRGVTADGVQCTDKVTFTSGQPTPPAPTPTPTSLPVTGAEGLTAIFTATTIGGAMAHRVYASRRFGRD